jgi:hypothetical protein
VERAESERDLPAARHWRRTAVALSEELLSLLKSQFFDPTAENRPSGSELQDLTGELARLERMGDAALIEEYRSARYQNPHSTGLMVRVARDREKAERRALEAYLRATDPEKR